MENTKYIKELFQRYLNNTITSEEVRFLLKHLDIIEREDLLEEIVQKHLQIMQEVPSSSDDDGIMLHEIYMNIQKRISDDKTPKSATVIPFFKRTWFRLSAAAAILFLIAGSILYLMDARDEKILVQEILPVQQEHDIPPGKQNAFLTLDDGRMIMLDSAANGLLTQQGNVDIQKIDGEISYNKSKYDSMRTTVVYNTISTANGNQYQLILTDGSKVWLNAASSIRFPTSFAGNERRVEITGEAYFEVAKDAKRKFVVEFNNQNGEKGEIEVLGTHFNVNAYPEESDVKTTLLEGSVKIKNTVANKILAPGQQAILFQTDIVINKSIDISQVMAWKDGYFIFNSTDIPAIMRQISRWYNVEIIVEDKITQEDFTGMISRDAPLSAIIKALELNDIKVHREGRKITITP